MTSHTPTTPYHHTLKQKLCELLNTFQHYFAPSYHLNQCWNIVNFTRRNKLWWNINRNSHIFIQEKVLKNVVCEIADILSQSQCVIQDSRLGASPLGTMTVHKYCVRCFLMGQWQTSRKHENVLNWQKCYAKKPHISYSILMHELTRPFFCRVNILSLTPSLLCRSIFRTSCQRKFAVLLALFEGNHYELNHALLK